MLSHEVHREGIATYAVQSRGVCHGVHAGTGYTDSNVVAERFQKAFCGVPVRNLSATTRKIFWPFFGLAILAVAFRFWARTRRMDGAGLGLDDWTILGSLVLLTAGNAILDQSKHATFCVDRNS